jgi:hypothetical protein
MIHIHSLDDLNRENILMAWSLHARTMTEAQFAQLCRVTAEELRREPGDRERLAA